MKLDTLTGQNNICLKVCGGPLSVTPGETGHPGTRSTRLSKGPLRTFACRCIVTCNTQRAWINKPIIWLVTATDTGVSLSCTVVAINNTSICQECAASPAKASGTSILCKQFREMVSLKTTAAWRNPIIP